MKLDAQIESILFYKNEPISIQRLASLCNEDTEAVREAVATLKEKLSGRGVTLAESDGEIQLGTDPAASDVIEKMYEEEINKNLTKAELEALSTILYRGPLPKSEIDYIRGVDSSTILRKLRIRGLIARKRDSDNKRRLLYHASAETLKYLGIESTDELPEYESVTKTINTFEERKEEARKKNPFEKQQE